MAEVKFCGGKISVDQIAMAAPGKESESMLDEHPSMLADEPEREYARRLRISIAIVLQTGIALSAINRTGQSPPTKRGFTFETMHEGTLGLFATNCGCPVEVLTDRRQDARDVGIPRNGPTDLAAIAEYGTFLGQAKCWANPQDTAREAQRRDQKGMPLYLGHQIVVPDDQVELVRTMSHRTHLRESGPIGDPQKAAAAAHASEAVTGSFRIEDSASTPITLAQAAAISRDPHGHERQAIERPFLEHALYAATLESLDAGRPVRPEDLVPSDIEHALGVVESLHSSQKLESAMPFGHACSGALSHLSIEEREAAAKDLERIREMARAIPEADFKPLPVDNLPF